MNKHDLSTMKIFTGISETSLSALLNKGEMKRYKVAHQVFRDKEQVDTLYMVVSGIVSLYKINEHGQKRVIFMLGPGKMINDVIIQDLPASINCEAFEDATLLCYQKVDFLEIMAQDFKLTQNVINSLAQKVRRMYRQLKNTNPSIKIEKRLAAKLWKLAKDHGVPHKDGTLINMTISITYVADLLGSQRETISRAMKILTDNELVGSYNKKILIYNKQKLADFFKAP